MAAQKIPVWTKVSLTSEAEAEVAKCSRDVPRVDDALVPVLINVMKIVVDGEQDDNFKPGYRCAFLRNSSLTDEVLVPRPNGQYVALRPDEFMSGDCHYRIEFSEGLFSIVEE